MASDDGTLTDLTAQSALAIVAFVLLIGSLSYGLQLVLDGGLSELYTNAIVTVTLIGTTVAILYAVGYALSLFERAASITPHQKELTYRFIQLLTFGGVLVIIIVHIWDVSAGNVILGAGVTSVIVAIAARQAFSSVLAGIVIMSTDIFRVGDWVKIDERFGEIKRISFFNTEVVSPQGERHVFPNDDLTARDITNLGSDRYRNDVLVGVDYETNINHAITVCDSLLEELSTDDTTLIDGFHPTTIKDFDESQITLAIKIWVEEPRPQAINQAQTTVLSRLHQRFADEGIEIPFPQRTLSDRESA